MRTLIVLLLTFCAATLWSQSLFDSLYAVKEAEVYFDFGKSALSLPAEKILDSLVAGLRANPAALRIRIHAHTDSIGSPEANLALSRRRAEAVYKGLSDRGLSGSEIEIAGHGEQQPVATNATEEGRQMNRRASLSIMATVPMATLEGQVRNPETGSGIADAIVNFRSRTREDSTRTDTAGYYRVRLPRDSIVKVEAVAPDYFFQSVTLKVFGSPELFRKYKISPNLELAPARPGERAVLRELFFVGNQAVLLKVSEPELPKVLRFMQVNTHLEVEIAGHVNQPWLTPDQLAPWEWELSVNRARLVYDYLLAKGIPETRMRYKGYGNREMLFPDRNATESQQQQNRRVEIRVLGTVGSRQ